MRQLNLALLVIGGLTLVLSLVAGFLRNKVYFLSEPLAAVLVGVAVGPVGLDLLHFGQSREAELLLEQVARLTLAVAVMGAALRLPGEYFRNNLRTIAAILGPGLVLMWITSGLLAYLLLDVSFWVAMLIGAVVSPTDPVLSGTIVTGNLAERNIPDRLRNFLTVESGANDGGAYPLVFLALLMIEHPTWYAVREWTLNTILWEVVFATVAGAAIGVAMGRTQKWSNDRQYVESTAITTVTVALALAVVGGIKLLSSDGILAVFAAGAGFNWVVAGASNEAEEEKVQETVRRLFSFPIFVFFGIAIPWEGWLSFGWHGVALAAAVLLFRRLPMMFVLWPFLDSLDDVADTFLIGWFGPIGIAALFYAMLAIRETDQSVVWIAGSLVIASSILVHGVTSTPFTKLYGRQTGYAESNSS